MQSDCNNEIEEFELHLTITRDFLVNLPKLHQQLKEELKLLEDERQDLLHYAEFGRFNAFEGYQIAKDLKRVSQQRRRVKNLLEMVQATHKRIKDKFNNVNLLNEALGEVRKIKDSLNKRYYTPRVRKDLTEKINVDCEQQSTKIK